MLCEILRQSRRSVRLIHNARFFTSSAPAQAEELKSAFAEALPSEQERLKALKKEYGSHDLHSVNVNMVLGGMRGITGLLYETSLLDADEGIRFRGYTIPELQKLLPTAEGGSQPLPEGLLWLLLTGELPTQSQVRSVSEDLMSRSKIPSHITMMLRSLPPGTHPMTQLSMAIMALQPDSVFARQYSAGIHKSKYWEPIFEDSLNLLGKLPGLAAAIYRNTYKDRNLLPLDERYDWAANLAIMMGLDKHDTAALDMMRMYQTIHADHEGGNVSAHTVHLVGSALADPYLSMTAGLNGLAGPLHGLANQEVLKWLKDVQAQLGETPSRESLEKFVWNTLKSGKVVPGYGHAVLRKTDPRYTCQREFALEHLPNDKLFKLVALLYDVVPGVLEQTGKVKNPWPNVDAHSGVILQHYGIHEEGFYTVLFGVSRAIGCLSQLVWSRGLGLPIERPKSVTMDLLEQRFRKASGG
eukprot:jgi/Ulvmu1/12679/UM094_0036.1